MKADWNVVDANSFLVEKLQCVVWWGVGRDDKSEGSLTVICYLALGRFVLVVSFCHLARRERD